MIFSFAVMLESSFPLIMNCIAIMIFVKIRAIWLFFPYCAALLPSQSVIADFSSIYRSYRQLRTITTENLDHWRQIPSGINVVILFSHKPLIISDRGKQIIIFDGTFFKIILPHVNVVNICFNSFAHTCMELSESEYAYLIYWVFSCSSHSNFLISAEDKLLL